MAFTGRELESGKCLRGLTTKSEGPESNPDVILFWAGRESAKVAIFLQSG